MFTLTPQLSAQAAVRTPPAAAVDRSRAVAGALHPMPRHPACVRLVLHLDRRQDRLSVSAALSDIGISAAPVPVSIAM